MPVQPAQWQRYEVLPDSQAKEVEVRKAEQELLLEGFAQMQSFAAGELMIGLINEGNYVIQAVRAVESVVDEVAEELDGEDPCLPENRNRLERLKPEIEGIKRDLRTITDEEFPEDGELRRAISGMILQGVNAHDPDPEVEVSPLMQLLKSLSETEEQP